MFGRMKRSKTDLYNCAAHHPGKAKVHAVEIFFSAFESEQSIIIERAWVGWVIENLCAHTTAMEVNVQLFIGGTLTIES